MAPTQQQCKESLLNNSRNNNNSNHSIRSFNSNNSSCYNSNTLNSSSSNSSINSTIPSYTKTMDSSSSSPHLLPINCRGLFYDDQFFQDTHHDFDQAIKEVLQEQGQRSQHSLDDLTSYRKLRETDLQDNNQAVSLTQDEHNNKVVLDVRDFMKGDVKVKVIDENQLSVEGTVEKEENGHISKKSFKRSFTFPGLVKPTHISAAMSSDGMLSITVPKNKDKNLTHNLMSQQQSNVVRSSADSSNSGNNHSQSHLENNSFHNLENSLMKELENDIFLPITKRGQFNHDDFFETSRRDFELSTQNPQFREDRAISVTEDHDSHKVVLDVKDFKDGDVKVKIIDENELKVEGIIEIQHNGATSSSSFNRSFTFPGLIKAEAVKSAMSSDGILTITVPKVATPSNSINSHYPSNSLPSRNHHQNTNVMQHSSNTSHRENSDRRASDTTDFDSFLPIDHKGLFFHDDFFKSARKDYENSVKDVLNNQGEMTSPNDNISIYRNLRDRDLSDETQAVTQTEDDKNHKVVMDAKDFMNDNLTVKIVDENELIVEGIVEKKEGGSISKKSFKRSFTFPGLVKPEAVRSAMSSDGILTITVPKQENQGFHNKAVHYTSDNHNLENSDMSRNNMSNHLTSHRNSFQSSNHDAFNNSMASDNFHNSLRSNSLRDFETESMLPVAHRDSFFNNFFENAHKEFENSVKIAQNQMDEFHSAHRDMNHFGFFQEPKSVQEKDQGVSIAETETAHKISIDVSDFRGEDLQVKAVDEDVLLIEGNSATKSFSRRFQLPTAFTAEKITSTLSKDGILTITAPKALSSSSNSIQNGASRSSVQNGSTSRSSVPSRNNSHHTPSQHTPFSPF